MKTSKLYKEERAEVIEKMEGLVASAEGRDMSSDEQSNFDSLNEKVEDLNKMATRAESFEKLQATKAIKEVTENTPNEIRDYSFQDAMHQAATGRLSGLVKEMDQEARNEARYTGQSFKGIAIPSSILTRASVATAAGNATEVMAWTDQLEANLVLASAGANFYSGVDNMKFPVFSSINSGFVPETGGSAPAQNGTATSLTLDPKKLISIVNVSAEAIAQNASIEAALRRNMAQSVAATLELALLGDSDITNAPTSIFLDAATQTVAGAAPTVAELLNMEATLLGNGVNLQGARMAWLLDSGALAEAKTLAQVSSVSPAYDNVDKSFFGYFAFTSSNVGGGSGTGTNYMLLDASKVHVAQFGGLDVIYDIYTNSGTGEPRYVLTSLVDGDMVQNSTAAVKIDNA